MRIEIHVIQNHSPANLNRDDLGAPKTCYFGGVIRSRISSQCLKRSIRRSDEFKELDGSIRTRRLAELVARGGSGSKVVDPEVKARAEKALATCGFLPKKQDKKGSEESSSNMLIFVGQGAVARMVEAVKGNRGNDAELANQFAKIIADEVSVPGISLSGRMLEPVLEKSEAKAAWKDLDTTVEAALQVAHAFSTHEARPEVDYYIAADDLPGKDAGAGFVGEAMFASACFYKYFSIDWNQLVTNLKLKDDTKPASNVVDQFIRAVTLTNPTGKQNSFAAHNPPAGILVEIRDGPLSYANAFADPVTRGERGIVGQSVAQLAEYIHDMDVGYGEPNARYWFSPNRHHKLQVTEEQSGKKSVKDLVTDDRFVGSLNDLIVAVRKECVHRPSEATPKVAQ